MHVHTGSYPQQMIFIEACAAGVAVDAVSLFLLYFSIFEITKLDLIQSAAPLSSLGWVIVNGH